MDFESTVCLQPLLRRLFTETCVRQKSVPLEDPGIGIWMYTYTSHLHIYVQ